MFFKKINEILTKLLIQGQDPQNDLVSALAKIEADLYFKLEINNYLFWKDDVNNKTTMHELHN